MSKKRAYLFIMGAILCISMAAASADDHGDSPALATPLALGNLQNGTIEVGDDVDYFSVSLEAGRYYRIETFAGTLSDTVLFLYDVDGVTLLVSNDDANAGDGVYTSEILWSCPASGTHFIAVESYGASSGSYSLMASLVPDDHANGAGAATPVTVGVPEEGEIEVPVDVDWFSLSLAAGTDYMIHLDSAAGLGDSMLRLFAGDGVSLLAENDNDPLGGVDSRLLFSCSLSGVYYVEASGASSASGSYRLTASEGFPVVFLDVTAGVGLAGLYAPAAGDAGVAWADANSDGYPDLYLGSFDEAKGVYLFYNNGGVSFSTAAMPNLPMWWPGLFVDYDNDGDLDLYSAVAGGHLARRKADGTYEDVTGILTPHAWQSECAAWGDFNGDGWLDFFRSGWEEAPAGPYYKDALFVSNGGVSFSKTWETPDGAEKAGRGVTLADFDEDHDLDIYVSNYRLARNHLWINDGAANFTEQAILYNVADEGEPCTPGVYEGGHSIGSAWGDLDNDGHLDLFVGNFSHSSSCQDRPVFYRNRGPASGYTFEIRDTLDGIDWVESSASPALADFDNDGDLDLFLTAVSGPGYPGQKSRLFRNDGNFVFTDVSEEFGLSLNATTSNFQAAWADYNQDGFLDLFTGRRLFKNPLSASGHHYLRVRVEGTGEAVDAMAVGTQVRLSVDGGVTVMTRQVETATGWGNQSAPLLHFGLGDHSGPVRLDVTWLNGVKESFNVEGVDRMVTIAGPGAPRAAAAGKSWPVYH